MSAGEATETTRTEGGEDTSRGEEVKGSASSESRGLEEGGRIDGSNGNDAATSDRSDCAESMALEAAVSEGGEAISDARSSWAEAVADGSVEMTRDETVSDVAEVLRGGEARGVELSEAAIGASGKASGEA